MSEANDTWGTTSGTAGADLLVVGGGIVGLSAAWEVASRGHRVSVVERARVAEESSWAAAGMLSPLGEAVTGGPMLAFGIRSLSLYTDWIAGIEARTGTTVEYGRRGKLQIAMSPNDVGPLRSLASLGAAAGIGCSWLEGTEVRALEPTVTPSTLGALYMEDDGTVDNRGLSWALADACREVGVRVFEGTPVAAIHTEGPSAKGVVLEDGSMMSADAVLVAAGAWSGTIDGVPRSLPVRPVRGQMLALRPSTLPTSRVLGHGHVYVVPREDGRVLIGATMEEAGFEKQNTHDGLEELMEGAVEILPSLASAPTVERWSGLRPGSRDGMPLIGADPDIANLYYATGHFRNGILLAPATAQSIADLLEHGASDILPPEFRPDRFGPPASVGPA